MTFTTNKSSDGWNEIQFEVEDEAPVKDLEIEIEADKDPVTNEEIEETPKEEPIEEKQEAEEPSNEETPLEEAPAKKEKGSRAQERIRELVKQKKDIEAKYASENEALKKQLSEMAKTALYSQKSFVEDRIKQTKQAAVRAQEEGRYDEATEMYATLNELQMQKSNLDGYEGNLKEEPVKPNQSKSEEPIDETEALTWLANNKDIWDNPTTQKLALNLSNKIAAEGFDPASPEFYDELDYRLGERLKNSKRTASSTDRKEEDQQGQQVEPYDDKQSANKRPPQTTAGASRTPPSIMKSSNGGNGKYKVSLTRNELEIAEQFGYTPEQYAALKYKAQKSANSSGGYVSVFENK